MPDPSPLGAIRRHARAYADRSRQLGVVAQAPAPIQSPRSLDDLAHPRPNLLSRVPFGTIAGYVLMTILAAIMAVPLYWMISGAFKEYAEIRAIPPIWVPQAWRDFRSPDALGFGNFTEAWNAAPFGRFYLNTLIITA